MLGLRIVTGVLLFLLVVSAIAFLDAGSFTLFMSLVIMIGGWEWARISGIRASWQRLLYALSLWPFMFFLTAVPMVFSLIMLLSLLWWLLALHLIRRYPDGNSLFPPWSVLLMGYLVLLPAWMALVVMRRSPDFIWLMFILLMLVALADIGAYFAGRAFGHHKLAERVSPNKTWEGFFGGMLCSLLGMALFLLLQSGSPFDFTVWQGAVFLLGCVIVIALSVVGDLLESMFKRRAGLKDSGRILPGHGGIMDRIDSFTAAAPAYALLLMWTGAL